MFLWRSSQFETRSGVPKDSPRISKKFRPVGVSMLKASNVYLYDLATGHVTVMSRIHPDTSTGRFAGATGVLFFSGKTISTNPFTVQTDIAGEICLANE